MPDQFQIYTHHVGAISYQGTAEDFARWGIPLPAPEATTQTCDQTSTRAMSRGERDDG